MNIPLLRLNQLADFFFLSSGRCEGWYEEAVVETMLGPGEDGRLRLAIGCCWLDASCDARGIFRDVRELLNDDRRELRLSSFRTPEGRRCGSGEDATVGCVDVIDADAGDMGTLKLSVRTCCVLLLLFEEASATLSFSGSGVGGKAPGMSSGVVG